MQVLIVVSVVSFSIETIPTLGEPTLRLLHYIELVTVGLFTLEYLLRIYVATPRRSYIFGFWGLVDLAAILPTYLAMGLDLRSIRALRLLRLFRIAKLARYSKALRRYTEAFRSVRAELAIFGGAALVLIYLSAVGIYYFERNAQPDVVSSVFDALWWAVATLTTVGYGDVYPVTVGGKMFTFAVLMIGLGIIAVPSGLLASAMTRAMEKEREREREKENQ